MAAASGSGKLNAVDSASLGGIPEEFASEMDALMAWVGYWKAETVEGAPRLTPWLTAWLTPATLHRYLVAERGDVAACKKRLVATAVWRTEHVAEGARCPECPSAPNSHCMIGLGPGLDGSPVVYASPPRAESTDPAAAVIHVACELEKGFAAAGATGRWVWLVDMRGYTLWSSISNTSSGIEMARVFSAHYPERLGQVMLLDPPVVFSVLFSVSGLVATAMVQRGPVHAFE